MAEENIAVGLSYVATIIEKIQAIENDDMERLVLVSDDLGLGKVSTKYTVSAVLIQAHSHTLHHYASIGYLFHHFGGSLPDEDFGSNLESPKQAKVRS